MNDKKTAPRDKQEIKSNSPKMGGGWADEDQLDDQRKEKQGAADRIQKTPGATWTMAPTSAEAEIKTISQKQSSAV